MLNSYQIITLLFGTGLLGSIFKIFNSKIKDNFSKTESVQLGVQALLRDRLYQSYFHYCEKGFAPIYARENFENMYNHYHQLGGNGVMDDVYDKFMCLPLEKEEN